MRVFSIAWKDFRHTYRNAAGLAMMIIAPLLLAGALGAAFGSSGNYSISAVKTVVVNEDSGATQGSGKVAYGNYVAQALNSKDVASYIDIKHAAGATAAKALVDQGDAAVAVIIAKDFSQTVAQGKAQVLVYRDPSLTTGPAIVNSIVDAVVQSINGAYAAANGSVQLALSSGILDQAKLTSIASKAAAQFSAAAQSQAAVTVKARAPVVAGAGNRPSPNVASQVLLGMMIFFMFFGAATPARSILDEHRKGTLGRLFTTSTPRSVVLAGKYVSVFVVVLAQSVILLLIGRFLMNAHWGFIGPVIALTLAGALVASALGLVTVAFAKTPAQAGAVSSAIFVFLALLGGNFFGSNVQGGFAKATLITPNGWLLKGWNQVIFGGSWDSMYLPLIVSVAYALVLFAIANVFFRRRYA